MCKEVTHGCILVMDGRVAVEHKYHFGPRHLSRAPHARHDAPALQRIRLVNAHERCVVEAPEHWQVVIVNIVNDGLQKRHKDAFSCLAYVIVFLRWQSNYGGWVDGIASMRDGGDFNARVAVGQAVETGVITEWAFKDCARSEWLTAVGMPSNGATFGAHPALDHDFRVCWHPERDCLCAHHGNAATVQEAAHEEFADTRWQWSGGAIGHDTFATEADGDRHALPEFFPTAPVRGAIVVHVPVHGERCWSQQLAAVHADVVACGACGIAVISMNGVHASEGDVTAGTCGGASGVGVDWESDGGGVSVEWPALQDGQSREVHFVARGEFHHFLARTTADALGTDLEERRKLARFGQEFARSARWNWFGEACDPCADGGDATGIAGAAERVFHSSVAAPEIDGKWEVATGDAFKEQGTSADGGHGGVEAASACTFEGWHTADAINDLSDFKLRIDFGGHAMEFTSAVECRDEIAESSVHARDGRSVYDCRPDARY